MGGDARMAKCCCGGIPAGTRLAIWQYGNGHAGYAFMVGEAYPYSWAVSMGGFAATYRSYFSASFYPDGYPGGFPNEAIHVVGTYAASSGTYSVTGDNVRFVKQIFNVISGKTATGYLQTNPPTLNGTGVMLFRVPTESAVEISTTGDAIAFTDEYTNGFTPRIVAYGDTDEWLTRPPSGKWWVYNYLDYTYFDAVAGQVDPWYPGLTVHREFNSLAAAEAYLATL